MVKTCISIICTRVLSHMVLSIGDMRQNGIQHHAPPDDPFLLSVIVLFKLVIYKVFCKVVLSTFFCQRI